MAIFFEPTKLLKRMASKRSIKQLLTGDLTVNRAAVLSLERAGVLSRKKLEEVAIKVIRQYKEKRRLEIKAGATPAQATATAVNDKKLLVQRVQNAATQEITQEVKDQYYGEFYRWLPSTAVTPDPLHQLNYGKTFQVGVGDRNGEDPGDRDGCQCGMEILVKEDTLNL